MPEEAVSDEELMQAVAQGNLDAFEQLFLRYQSAAWSVAYRFTGDAAEAEDLVSDSFLRILDAAERYKPTASFRTYFYRILTRRCIDFTRKKRPIATDNLPPVLASGYSQSEAVVHQEHNQHIQNALEQLSEKHRLVVVLRYFEGFSNIAIAEMFQSSPKSIERMLARARKHLKPLLQSLLEED